jgi:LacI family transcriptional regulator
VDTRDRRPTIIDVARAAGISKSTVSLVLRNSPQVRDETRVLVREAMAKIGYVYNRAAATLRSANAGLVGLVINDLRNPFFTEFATSLQMALSARGYATVVANTDENPDVQSQVIAAMIEHGVAALVVSPAYGREPAVFDPIARAAIPTMQVLRKVDPRFDLFPFAAPDYRAGSRLAAEHLLEAGARRIAFVGGIKGRAVTQERRSGYLAALKKAGMEPLIVDGRASRAFGREAAQRLASKNSGIDAAICFNDLVALGMLSGFAQIGSRVGTAFKIVGFDDIEECAQSYPSLTTVRCDIAGFGERIAATILAWLEEGIVPPPELRTPVSLVIRDSSRAH